jgi:signal transduction histidine kinase
VRVAALLDRTTATSRVSGVRVYDASGRLRYQSSSMGNAAPPPDALLRSVLAGEAEATFEREADGERMFAVIRSIREPGPEGSDVVTTPQGPVLGALEVTQPYTLLLAELRRVEVELALATGLLMLTVTVAIAFVSRRLVGWPLEQLVAASRALGEGDVDARVPQTLGAAEPNDLAREFNLMAERLAGARSELLRQGEERVRLERRLAEAEKLATVGTLAAGLAHEIGAPLNVISGRAEMLLGQEQTPTAMKRHLGIIVAQSGRITRTVRSLLDYARRPARRDEPVSMDAVVHSTIDLLESECQRAGVTVDYRPGPELRVLGDADQLQQVFTNLLVNAMQAMDGQADPRTVTITVAPVVSPETGMPLDVVVTVDDTGPGLPADLDGRLFTPFATTKPSGTGLGLVVARSIVQDHGGTIDGTNRTDGTRGARFTIRLPFAPRPARVPAAARTVASATRDP